MNRNAASVFSVLLITFLSAIGWAQTTGTGGGGTATPTPAPSAPSVPTTPRGQVPNPNNFPSMDVSRPIYLHGRVVLDRGGELSEPVPISAFADPSLVGKAIPTPWQFQHSSRRQFKFSGRFRKWVFQPEGPPRLQHASSGIVNCAPCCPAIALP